jgi:hypothetical protein
MAIEGQIVIGADGKLALRTTTGTFEGGSGIIKMIADSMKAQGVEFDGEVKPEQHIHDKEHESKLRVAG